ncbi:TerB family tellurite resistance protein [Kitasatospora sp. NPDC004799]|uniref:TerB family tellurite resistance protein n=1 Tax=Kitasatospora sp. NPDC004799 TaxID=3154460 RepID=UPI0033BB2A5F
MESTHLLPMSELCRELYGLSGATREAFLNYGKALLVIAGADGEVSEPEFAWLVDHQRRMGAPEDVIELYREFDFRTADLDDLLPAIRTDVETWQAAPHLVYHAIRMCGADGVYAPEERAQVLRAARLMGVPDDIVLSLHALVDLERAVHDLRTALFHVSTLADQEPGPAT